MPAKRKSTSPNKSPGKKANTGTSCAIIGGDGSLTHQAASEYFGTRSAFAGRASFEEVFQAVEDGTCDYGMVPIENSHSGSLFNVYTLLTKHKLFIIGEHASRDAPCLIAPKGLAAKDITRVYSHPTVLANCSQFLIKLAADEKISFDQISMANTSSACAVVAAQTIQGSAAISSRRSAETHGLDILFDTVANDKNLTTRYILLSKQRAEVVNLTNKSDRKHSLALTVQNSPGSIFKMMSAFAFRSINVLKLDGRPGSVAMDMFADGAKHWEYVHFVDFEPSIDGKANAGLMRDLEEFCTSVRDFGEYKKWADKDDVVTRVELLWQ